MTGDEREHEEEDDYGEEVEDEEGFDDYDSWKEQIVYLVDTSKDMFDCFIKESDDSQEPSIVREITYFTYAMNMALLHLKNKVFANPNDEIAVIFYGTVSRDTCTFP
jgi:hypothetical protein